MTAARKPYQFDASWQGSVDRNGPEWKAYCEVTSLVKRYIRTRLREGKDAAVAEFEATCELYAKSSMRGAARVEMIRETFRLVWANEREALRDKVYEQDLIAKAV